MKRFFIALLAFGLLGSFCLPAAADTDKPAKTEKKVKKTKKGKDEEQEPVDTSDLPAVPASLVNKKTVNGTKVNTKAKVYFLYQSRSTCGICVMECPAIVSAYKSMKGKEAELVMLNIDANADVAAKWAKSSKMKFPVLAPGNFADVPFPYTGEGLLPCMVAVDAEGNKLGQANGNGVAAFVSDWKKVLRDYKKEEKKAARKAPKPAEDDTDDADTSED